MSRHVTSRHVTSYRVSCIMYRVSYVIYHIASHRIASYRIVSYIISYHISCHIISYPILRADSRFWLVNNREIWSRISRLTSSAWDIKTKERHWWRHNGDSDRRPLSLPLRYDLVSYHIISYHIISHHIISYHMHVLSHGSSCTMWWWNRNMPGEPGKNYGCWCLGPFHQQNTRTHGYKGMMSISFTIVVLRNGRK